MKISFSAPRLRKKTLIFTKEGESNSPLRLPEEKLRHPALMDRLDPLQGAAINKQMQKL